MIASAAALLLPAAALLLAPEARERSAGIRLAASDTAVYAWLSDPERWSALLRIPEGTPLGPAGADSASGIAWTEAGLPQTLTITAGVPHQFIAAERRPFLAAGIAQELDIELEAGEDGSLQVWLTETWLAESRWQGLLLLLRPAPVPEARLEALRQALEG